MRKMMAALIFLAFSSASFNTLADSNKETVCHKGKDISVAKSAVAAHRNHGDTVGSCDDDRPTPIPEPKPKPDTMAAVVMMRCEAQLGNGVLVVSVSSSPDQGISARDDCAAVLAELLDEGFAIRSISSGSAEAGDGSLRLYTDYLLLKKILIDDEASIDDD